MLKDLKFLKLLPKITAAGGKVINPKGEILFIFRNNKWDLPKGKAEDNESIADTAIREVKEEVGILVDNVRYIKSQSWPFPSQLMLGFHADYVSGEIVVEPTELEEAAWFDIANLPSVPSAGISVAGELIQLYKEEIERIKA